MIGPGITMCPLREGLWKKQTETLSSRLVEMASEKALRMQCNPGQTLQPRRRAETHKAEVEVYVPLGYLGYTLYKVIRKEKFFIQCTMLSLPHGAPGKL